MGGGDRFAVKIAVLSTKRYDREFLQQANAGRHELSFLEPRLTIETASLADAQKAVCVFGNDNLVAAQQHEITVVHVPVCSPYRLRSTPSDCIAYNRLREENFALETKQAIDAIATATIQNDFEKGRSSRNELQCSN